VAAYYNENDPKTAAWLRELIKAGLIADGEVDTRSIVDVRPADLRGFVQCHFFAGIGGWSYALRLAGWPDGRECWTGSCPCQFRSSAARGRHSAADRWPPFRELIAECRPARVFGEQVDEARSWVDGVCADMERLGYATWATVLPAYCVGRDHARERIYFVCDADSQGESSRAVNAEVGRVPRHHCNPGIVVREDGLSDRVALLRGFGNAIVPEVAAEFIGAYLEAEAATVNR
jgi:DNA (cytosine-5)-methyltransferase 1